MKPVRNAQRIAASEEAGSTGIRDRLISLNPQWEIALEALVRYVCKVRPQGMSVRPVAKWTPWDATEANLK